MLVASLLAVTRGINAFLARRFTRSSSPLQMLVRDFVEWIVREVEQGEGLWTRSKPEELVLA